MGEKVEAPRQLYAIGLWTYDGHPTAVQLGYYTASEAVAYCKELEQKLGTVPPDQRIGYGFPPEKLKEQFLNS